MGFLAFCIFAGGFKVSYDHHRKSEGRIGAFFSGLSWPFELGEAIARALYED
jgi:hypothetical protein